MGLRDLFGKKHEDKKGFCFIICVSNEAYFSEASFYINKLKIPDGYSVEIFPVRDIPGMAAGYNTGMTSTTAKYKIYMHQDVFVLNPNFLSDILTVFSMDKKIGMIGMIGSRKLAPDALPWHSDRVGNIYELDRDNVNFAGYSYKPDDGLTEVEAAEGFLLATCTDIAWRDDLFDGWDYYDMAQCFEFRKAGYKVVVPEQRRPWVAHDESINNRWTFDKSRRVFMEQYMKFWGS